MAPNRLKTLLHEAWLCLTHPSRLIMHVQRRLIRKPGTREKMAKIVSIFKPGKSGQFRDVTYIQQIDLDSFTHDGFQLLGDQMSAEDIDDICKFLNNREVYDSYHPEWGFFHPNSPLPQARFGKYKSSDVLRAPHVIEFANRPEILSFVQDFLGTRPLITACSLWWSFKHQTAPEESQKYHRDFDDFKLVKLFVYLTDVGMEDGPHVYVKASPMCNRFIQNERLNDEEVKNYFGQENIVPITGHKGSSFFVNTYGVHKGLLPKQSNRLVLEICYSLMPAYKVDYQPEIFEDDRFRGFDPYINKLFFKYAKPV